MPYSRHRIEPSAFVHLILRGVRQAEIFRDDSDRRVFLARLDHACVRYEVRVLAWALMSNHVHLLVRRGACRIRDFVRSFASTYARAFNRHHGMSGYVFEGRTRRVPIRTPDQLLTCLRYVHLNPVVAGLVRGVPALATYPWTGHSALVGGRVRRFQDVRLGLQLFGDVAIDVARVRLVEFMEAGLVDEREHWVSD